MTRETWNELSAVIHHWLIWFTLGHQDIKLRYRRSSIGPFWITLSMAITIGTLGLLYSHLFKIDLQTYLPHLAASLIGWMLISTLIIESCNAFVDAENFIKNKQSYFSIYIMRLVLRNVIIFAHNLLVFIPVAVMYQPSFSLKILWLIPGLLIISLVAVFWGGILAVLGTRYRDFTQIMNSMVQVLFFVTPIMWLPSFLSESYQWVVLYNPFNQLLNLVRSPLIDQSITLLNWGIVALVLGVGFLLYAHFM
ncbi:MAG: ABC transporter permease, partial [Legionellales bacterium]|nr:ABC transporter permease [Legionellales bacterium]